MNKKTPFIKIIVLSLIVILSYQCGEIEANPDLTIDLIGEYQGVSQLKTKEEDNSLNDSVNGTIPEADTILININKLSDTSIEVANITDNENTTLFTAELEQASDGIAIIVNSQGTLEGFETDSVNTPGWHGAFQIDNNRLVYSTEEQIDETTSIVNLFSGTKQ